MNQVLLFSDDVEKSYAGIVGQVSEKYAKNTVFNTVLSILKRHGAWSVGRGAWGVGRGAWSVERGAWSVGRGAWSVGRAIAQAAWWPWVI